MDRLIVILIAFVLCLMNKAEEEEVEVLMERPTKLNPEFYVDENAFMEVANALVFGDNSGGADSADMGMRTQPVYSVSSDTQDNVQHAPNGYGSSRQRDVRARRYRHGGMDSMEGPSG